MPWSVPKSPPTSWNPPGSATCVPMNERMKTVCPDSLMDLICNFTRCDRMMICIHWYHDNWISSSTRYHVFYEFMAGHDNLEKFYLNRTKSYKLLATRANARDDTGNFKVLLQALHRAGMDMDDQFFNIIAIRKIHWNIYYFRKNSVRPNHHFSSLPHILNLNPYIIKHDKATAV